MYSGLIATVRTYSVPALKRWRSGSRPLAALCCRKYPEACADQDLGAIRGERPRDFFSDAGSAGRD